MLKADGRLNPEYIRTRSEIDSTPMIYKENETLGSISLPEGWAWANPDQILTLGHSKQTVNYTSSDSNYENVENVVIDIILLQAADYTELEEYLSQMEDGIGFDHLVSTDYTNYEALEELVISARAQKAQVELDKIFVQIEAYVLEKRPIDRTKFDEYLREVDELVETDYYASDWAQLQEKIQIVEEQTLISKFEEKFKEAREFVIRKKYVDTYKLDLIKEELAKLNKDDYSAESWQKVQDLIKEANEQKLQSKFDKIVESIDLNTILVEKQVVKIELSQVPQTSYIFGETLNVEGGRILVIYDNKTQEEISINPNWVTGFNNELLDETQQLTITYEGCMAIYSVTVNDVAIGINVEKPEQDVYRYGEDINLDGLKVVLQMKSGKTNPISINDCRITGYDKNTLGIQTITVKYQEYEEKTFEVRVNDYVIGIKLTEPIKKTYSVVDTRLVTQGMKVETIMASGNAGSDVTRYAIIDDSNVDFKVPGSKDVYVTYEGYTKTFTIVVNDTEKPFIALNGEREVTIEVGTKYVDAGAIATTSYGTTVKNVPTKEPIDECVNTNELGDYTITYVFADVTGKQADEVTRIVHVVDTTAPIITINNDNEENYVMHIGTQIPAFSATATDNYKQGEIDVEITHNIIPNKLGTYTVTFTATDGKNVATITRTFRVIDIIAPVIDVRKKTETIQVNTPFDPLEGVSVYDNSGETIIPNVKLNDLNTKELGTYTITYTAKDSSGNEAIEVNKTIIVIDTIAPTFKEFNAFKGNKGDTLYVVVGTEFTDPGVVFTDNYTKPEDIIYDTPIVKLTMNGTTVIVPDGEINYNKEGAIYTITYTARDKQGNVSDSVTRTIKITKQPPTIYYKDLSTIVITNTTKENPKVFLYDTVIYYTDGVVTLTKDGLPFEMPEDGKLSDGEYVMTVKGVDEDGNLNNTENTQYIVVDTKPPEIIGLKATNKTKESITVTFVDVTDVASAVLTDKDYNVIYDVKKYLEENNTNQYNTPSEVGTYYLIVKDAHGKEGRYKIVVQAP